MEGQRQKAGGGRRRRRKKKSEPKAKAEPVMIVARRPDSPRILKVSNRSIAASAQPKNGRAGKQRSDEDKKRADDEARDKPRRAARIIEAKKSEMTDEELRSQRLLERLLMSEGRTAISQAVDALDENGIRVPEEQEPQLQLLEHVDERRACEAMQVIARLLELEPPIKRPILDQRLRRLEDEAEEVQTREAAAALRRTIRVA